MRAWLVVAAAVAVLHFVNGVPVEQVATVDVNLQSQSGTARDAVSSDCPTCGYQHPFPLEEEENTHHEPPPALAAEDNATVPLLEPREMGSGMPEGDTAQTGDLESLHRDPTAPIIPDNGRSPVTEEDLARMTVPQLRDLLRSLARGVFAYDVINDMNVEELLAEIRKLLGLTPPSPRQSEIQALRDLTEEQIMAMTMADLRYTLRTLAGTVYTDAQLATMTLEELRFNLRKVLGLSEPTPTASRTPSASPTSYPSATPSTTTTMSTSMSITPAVSASPSPSPSVSGEAVKPISTPVKTPEPTEAPKDKTDPATTPSVLISITIAALAAAHVVMK